MAIDVEPQILFSEQIALTKCKMLLVVYVQPVIYIHDDNLTCENYIRSYRLVLSRYLRAVYDVKDPPSCNNWQTSDFLLTEFTIR
jgi:hypothetical protein